MTELVIRPARDEDAEAAAALAAAVFDDVSVDHQIEKAFGLLNGTSWRERKAAAIIAEVSQDPSSTLVAERAGQVVGFVTTAYDPVTRVGRIPNLGVAASEQGKGVGKRLMQAAYELLRSRGALYLQIETLETNERGRRFYPKLGFREVARKIYYFMEVDQWQAPDVEH